jgi:hypothetical protein
MVFLFSFEFRTRSSGPPSGGGKIARFAQFSQGHVQAALARGFRCSGFVVVHCRLINGQLRIRTAIEPADSGGLPDSLRAGSK